MKYTTILIDLDDTLLDFQKAETIALEVILNRYLKRIDETIKKKYQQINLALWEQYEKGEINRQDIYNRRFTQLFKQINVIADGKKANDEYLEEIPGIWISGAEEMCKTLSKQCSIYVTTNGKIEIQSRKMEKMGLLSYIQGSFISEEVGAGKPKKEYFDYVLSHLLETDKSKILVVGDRLGSDIKGGNNAGLDTCWYNPNKKEKTEQVTITYEIQKLEELLEIIK